MLPGPALHRAGEVIEATSRHAALPIAIRVAVSARPQPQGASGV